MALIDLDTLTPASFPSAEDDDFEFKSSRTTEGQIKTKLTCAVSAMANSGGGCFIWGVADEGGDPDGGVESEIGRQPLKEWIEKLIHQVEPTPSFDVKLYDSNEGRGTLGAGKMIAAVSIHPSESGPHMAPD